MAVEACVGVGIGRVVVTGGAVMVGSDVAAVDWTGVVVVLS